MNHIITCSPIGKIKSLKDPVDNFIVCHFHEYDAKFYYTKKTLPIYEIFVQDENCNEVDELLDTYHEENVNVHEVPALSEIPTIIAETVALEYSPEDLLDENSDIEVPSVYLSADVSFSNLMTSALNREFRNSALELECVNLIKYYGMTEFSAMVQMMKRELETDFIYSEDPVLFAYVTNHLLRGNSKRFLA